MKNRNLKRYIKSFDNTYDIITVLSQDHVFNLYDLVRKWHVKIHRGFLLVLLTVRFVRKGRQILYLQSESVVRDNQWLCWVQNLQS